MAFVQPPKKRWLLQTHSAEAVQALAVEFSLNPLIAQILVHRKIQAPEDVQLFLNPTLQNLASPFLLKDIDKALARIEQALQNQELITIYGDYDVDGTTSSALLYLFLKSLGARVETYIPHRVKEGYGLNVQALKTIRNNSCQLVITVDNGISAIHEAQVAQSLGIDLIIVDHHQVPEPRPVALAILNPKQSDCAYPYKELAAVGVTFQLVMALRHRLRQKGFFEKRPEPDLKTYLDLVALGTIADVVPLTGQNRILVTHGLKVLSQTQNIGMQALKKVAQVNGEVSPGQVGFRLGPRINAAGRLDSASIGFELLTTDDSQKAARLAEVLNQANQERRDIEDSMVQEACERVERDQLMVKRRSLILFEPHWHVGVIGIVASRLVDRYYLPTLVGTEEAGLIRCSARSISGLNLYETLKSCDAHLVKYGGHHHAAGLSFPKENYDIFWDAFDAQVRQTLADDAFIPAIKVDGELTGTDLNESFVEALQTLAPFGQGNPEPIFKISKLECLSKRVVGENHLKLTLKKDAALVDAIGFRMANAETELGRSIDCVFSCEMNEWQGMKRVQLHLVDTPRNQEPNDETSF